MQGRVSKRILEVSKTWVVQNPDLFVNRVKIFFLENRRRGYKFDVDSPNGQLIHLIAYDPKTSNPNHEV